MYAEIANGQLLTFPYNWDNLVRSNPNTSFPSDIDFVSMYATTAQAGHQLVKVTEADAPSYNVQTQTIVKNAQPTLSGGNWILGWTVSSLSIDEQTAATATQAATIRQQRNAKLTSCDWTQTSDNPMSPTTKTAWATYRQALRDLTKESGFPWTITWPTDPTGH